MIKISFVLPIYNVEDYLEECVYSIVKQNKNNIEILLIDDGSKDNSGLICDELANKYKNVMAFHKENGGLASARNYGLKKAKGEYIAFVDSDDLLYEDCIDKIINYLDNNSVDILFMNMDKFYPDGTIITMGDCIESHMIKGKNDVDYIEYLSTRPKFPGSVCSKIYNLSFLKSYNLCFPSDNRVAEDLGFTLDCLMQCKSIDKLEEPYYLYRQSREGSITNNVQYKSFLGIRKFIIESVEKFTNQKKPKDKKSRFIMSFVSYEFAIMLEMYQKIDNNKIDMLDFLQNYKWVMQFANEKKLKIIYILLKIFGIKGSSKIVHFIKKNKK